MFTLDDKFVAAGSPPQQEGMPSYWTTYIASDDADDTAAKIRDAGGTVFMDPFDVFDSGRMTVAQDPTGATFGVWQANGHIGAQLANEPGTQLWNQCHTPDPARATEFYVAVFGYEVDEIDMGGEQPFRVLKVNGRGIGGVREPVAGEPPSWSVTFAVADADETAARAKELGGTRADGAVRPARDRPARRGPGSGRRRLPDHEERRSTARAAVLELAAQDRSNGAERDLRVRELGLSRRQPLQRQTGQQKTPEHAGRMLHRLPELHRHADREDCDDGAGERGAPMLGARRSKAAVTGIASAAKFVPQRGEKRLGRTAPVHVVSSERSSAAAIARCSAPCRRSVRPRKSQRMISTVVRIPAGSSSRPGARRSRAAPGSRPAGTGAHEQPATPRPRTSGVIDADQLHQAAQERDPDGRRASASASRPRAFHRVGRERPERSLTITTPFGRAIPPSFGSESARSARARTSAARASTYT